LSFNCFEGHPAADCDDESTTQVVLLHGFPEFADMYHDLQGRLSQRPVCAHSVACNQRGYSKGARPPNIEDYNYNNLVSDVYATADEVFGPQSKFHLVGHDHGAVLGWVTAARDSCGTAPTKDEALSSRTIPPPSRHCDGSGDLRKRIKSYTSMSVPHVDALSAGLLGKDADSDQQAASQYFSVFVKDHSNKVLSGTVKKMIGNHGSRFGDRDSLDNQKILWWYNGADAASIIAFPPWQGAIELLEEEDWISSGTRLMGELANLHNWDFSDRTDLQKGKQAEHPSGPVSLPVLFICGEDDAFLLCSKPYAKATKNYVLEPESNYEYLGVKCGHWIPLSCGNTDETKNTKEILKIHNAVVRLITRAEAASSAVADSTRRMVPPTKRNCSNSVQCSAIS